jgi:hypothetical protein
VGNDPFPVGICHDFKECGEAANGIEAIQESQELKVGVERLVDISESQLLLKAFHTVLLTLLVLINSDPLC